MSGPPDPKSRSLARGERRRFRHKATKAEWQRIVKAKQGPCRLCVRAGSNGFDYGKIEFHHLVPRSQGGDDVEDNIVPLHSFCHKQVHSQLLARTFVGRSLTDSEYAYVVGKLGESGPARLFGVGR